MKIRIALIILLALIAVPSTSVRGWGSHGHEISGRAAAMRLPQQMPAFFRKASDQLSYLNPEPDRWRDRNESNLDRAMDSAAAPDHFLDMELVPESAVKALNRYDFTAEMIKAGQKPTTAGFVTFRMLELFQRVRVEFRLWRAEKNPLKRRWIEQRIINDAGILGHYVSDTANPHHTTIHYNGWSGDNPHGYTTYSRERGIHFRFEEEYVGARIKLNDVVPLVSIKPNVFENPREAIWQHLKTANALVEQLYILDKKEPFSETNTSPEHKSFVTNRLADGAQMLRDLWWTAWITSELPPEAPKPQN